jgi:hypothetical protein
MKTKKKVYDTFKRLIREHVESLGGKPRDELRFGIFGFSYDLVLDTKCGPLGITPYEEWVACRFYDVERAKAHPISGYFNQYSGKWNHHYFCWPVEDALADFVRQLNEVL